MPPVTDAAVLVGASTADDAAVYKISDDLALIQTVDFFTPVVDDPYDFGAISAANSISDVYAMGGTPVLAMNIVGFPRNHPKAPLSALEDILRGGGDKAVEANISIVGGHTIDDDKPKYGMAVTGFVHPDKVWKNQGAMPGDRLLLTKPIGTGIITTAMRAGEAADATVQEALRWMAMLNKDARDAGVHREVHACTDVTGFGLLGHIREMLNGQIDATVRVSGVGIIEGTRDLAQRGFVPGGSRRNKVSVEAVTTFDDAVSEHDAEILCDAQTSGGLLFAMAPTDAKAFVSDCEARGVPVYDVGEITDGVGRIRVVK